MTKNVKTYIIAAGALLLPATTTSADCGEITITEMKWASSR
jgi:hypothetical protein